MREVPRSATKPNQTSPLKVPARNGNGRPVRRYGFACAGCRRKKARCDGATPVCHRCRVNNEECHFDNLETRIHQLDSLISRLRNSDDSTRLQILRKYFDSPEDTPSSPEEPNTPDTSEDIRPQECKNEDPGDILEEVTLDSRGNLCFYGATSFYHWRLDPKRHLSQSSNMPTASALSQSRSCSTPFQLGLSPGYKFPYWEVLGISEDRLQNLLETYWCFPHHLHLVLSRRIFLHDFVTAGPFVTPFLLCSVLSQAARYSEMPGAMAYGDQFAAKALSLLSQEIEKGSSIPTIQGLLILSARECACGRISQGWVYSGIGFRMMKDMGIHIPTKNLSQLPYQFSDEELRLRQQIFWSCYTWDKTMSLCLGRAPTVQTQMPIIQPNDILDGEEAECEPWRANFGMSLVLEQDLNNLSRTNTRFSAYCELCTLINDILTNLYTCSRSPKAIELGYFSTMISKLYTWDQSLPPEIHIHTESSDISCPPLHILLLNLLYHSTIILLCRRFFAVDPEPHKLATKAAQSIDTLLLLHIRRFGLRIVTFLESYTAFVASTVNIIDLRRGADPHAARSRLSLNLEVLRSATSTPANKNSVAAIENILTQKEDNSVGSTPWDEELNEPQSSETISDENHESSNSRGMINQGPQKPWTPNYLTSFSFIGQNVSCDARMEAGPNLVPGSFSDCDNTDEFLVDIFGGSNGSADAGVDFTFTSYDIGSFPEV
ncbi:uncharacterized protein ASPGLDRAFT_55879 [Aspergillus glaucus CBS 516.65]|uniref:Zn(2)-C6 fungal-type domain-containing protein n=1 Tax=Aspergillus glaucus CBS 516.65 TaxID=1160497 RepID=A0A1L9VU90_ASPGL|nr:hypothetical protein ASPGLDRAFT_55879 [Aspergillus glaucus CBS 516.65]OJJ87456.1 hypothetical protein ASPGLDRAFT_55879 [Aspergillus glaucus CBS 516.65]